MRLQSYLAGRWQSGTGAGRPLVNATTGVEIARADATGLDIRGALDHAREKGGAALRAMTFAQRGALLKAVADALQARRDEYGAIARENSGNTAADASVDIDGGIFTLKTYARLGQLLGDTTRILEPGQEQLARDPVFFARHVWATRPGVSVQINAFNFPSWGMWEKVAQATLAGVPSLAKPAVATALLSEAMVRDVVAARVVPDGVLSLVCGSGEGLVEALGPMDSVAFTGSSATAMVLRIQVAGMAAAPRLTVEADSVNATILGPDVKPGQAVFDLALREAVKALSVKAGQLCTNIRRILVPAEIEQEFTGALAAMVSVLRVGDPADESTRVGPLINVAQREEALRNIDRLSAETKVVAQAVLPDVAESSGFVAPTLLRCAEPASGSAVHELEVFGPCATVLAYRDLTEAIVLATKAEGSLALSLFSEDAGVQARAVAELGPWHGRLMLVDGEVGKAHTGHAIVMPQCVHGGPGRAGGGEELGGLRGLRFHMQRSAVQGGPRMLATIAEHAAEQAL
ncbi:3,4-dehydroadipyl-CoA semialdehyde dehydrogenase [Mesorhizobium sp. L-8-3]|uniref:3,4-dehydroadipyl-CoA semialdehyde dehydrogenase n=1 Tax=Mesorhizobium sp. L-8-3 TaxID=2744522 RepID=UPI001928D13A|nr:3,4-dehydroadipyl-CoA semialdehyde dehydrogenase [Mesorhizobium sp. L-8-3]BCH20342.1 bifunctional aldehyde dehydrogenase/enoyl-CoA hydratase [Mesorhizobium sp. L-8-3]